MGIEDTINHGKSLLTKEEQALVEQLDGLLDPKKQKKYSHEEFEGYESGVIGFANDLYSHTKTNLQSEEKLTEHSAIEKLVIDNLKKLKTKDEQVNNLLNVYDKFSTSGSFTSDKQRTRMLQELANRGLGWGEEELGLMSQYAKAAAKGDKSTYLGILDQLAQKTRETLFGSRVGILQEKLSSTYTGTEGAKHYFLHKTLTQHKHHPIDLDAIEKMDFMGAATTHYKLGEILGSDKAADVEKLKYKPVEKKKE